MKTWFINLPLLRKQLLLLLTVGMLPMIIIGALAYRTASVELQDKVFNQLTAVRGIKAKEIERHFTDLRKQITNYALDSEVKQALMGFTVGYTYYTKDLLPKSHSHEDDVAQYYKNAFAMEYQKRTGTPINTSLILEKNSTTTKLLQNSYINLNSNQLGEKHKLDEVVDSKNVYDSNHKKYHPVFRRRLESFGYYDMFLVDGNTGDVVYTVFKELDFATNLLSGPWANTGLSQAFKGSQSLAEGESIIIDFAPYVPSYSAPAAFIASPIFIDGKRAGALIIQVPIEPINAIMQERSGMGKTGESYLVGNDHLMRSDSYLDQKHHSVITSFADSDLGAVNTVAAKEALNGKVGQKIITDYNGNSALSSYAPLTLDNLHWAILVEIDKAEAFSAITSLRNTILLLTLGIIAAIVICAIYTSRLISFPVVNMAQLIDRVEREGNFQLSLNNDSKDEIGNTTRAFNLLIKNLALAFQQINSVLHELSQGGKPDPITQSYPGDLGQLVAGVNAAAEQIQTSQTEQKRQSQRAADAAAQARQSAMEAQNQATQTLIVKQALDVCGTSVMIADTDFNLIYTNHALNEMMQEAEPEFRQILPHFSSRDLIGSNIDLFHKSPEHQRRMLQELHGSYKTRLKISSLTFDFTATPIRSNSGDFLGAVVEWKNLTVELKRQEEERRLADENARIRQALDSSSTSTMIADPDFNIIYVNHSLATMMTEAENDLNKAIHGFSAKQLIGKNMDLFHRNPLQTRAMLSQLKGTFSTQMNAGDRSFLITANTILNERGERLGTVVEWLDRTAEVAIEREIDQIIVAAGEGDFSRSISTLNTSGFFQRISVGLNTLLNTTNIALQDIIRVLGGMANGDLRQRIDRDYKGEFGLLKRDTNATLDKLADVISGISDASRSIASGAREISAGTADLSARTEEQASSLEETAASMEEITQTVRKNQDNANSATQLTTQACDLAKIGDTSVSQTSEAMNAIRAASDRIANIIGVIDDIAFQTNLLALNAAVEAARAGEQGRGFAVVASEVRNLAQRSASAARQIKSLIHDSGEKVESGTGLVTSSRQNLQAMVKEITQVSDMMRNILSSAGEQVRGIEQINSALLQMDKITQENAALVEEASAASETMADQARALDNMIAFFRIR